MSSDLSVETLRTALPRTGFGSTFRLLDRTGSTNEDAFAWADERAPEGAVVVADHQSQGRGRWGRTWLSEPGTGLLFSVILRPRLDPQGLTLIPTAIGVAITEALAEATGVPAELKWPNDVLVEGRKAVGILVESRGSGGASEPTVVAGVGVNVSWPDAGLPHELRERATSLTSAMEANGLGSPPRRPELLAALVRAIERRYSELERDPEGVVAAAAGRSCVIGKAVILTRPGSEPLRGTAVGLSPTGELRIDLGGEVRAVSAGEVETLRT